MYVSVNIASNEVQFHSGEELSAILPDGIRRRE